MDGFFFSLGHPTDQHQCRVTFFCELLSEVKLHGVIDGAVVVFTQNHHIAIIRQGMREVTWTGPQYKSWPELCSEMLRHLKPKVSTAHNSFSEQMGLECSWKDPPMPTSSNIYGWGNTQLAVTIVSGHWFSSPE